MPSTTKITRDVYAIDLCTYLPKSKTLIIADLHIGFEEQLAREGVLVPRINFDDLLKRLDWIFEQIEVKRIVLNGDIKHEFGRISKQEWNETVKLANFIKSRNIELVAVKGNHDTVFGPVAKHLGIPEVEELLIDDILVTHGDYIPALSKKISTIIIGHVHPAITLREKAKREKYKCFVKARFKKKILVVQPSFNPFTQGTDVLKETVLSPLLAESTNQEYFIVDEKTHEILYFGNVESLR